MIHEGQAINIEQAEVCGPYRLKLHFSDGHIQVIDLEDFLFSSSNPQIQKYQSADQFAAFEITEGELQWNDYDLCFPMEDLYENKNLGNKKRSAA